jgi:hypothetical protein
VPVARHPNGITSATECATREGRDVTCRVRNGVITTIAIDIPGCRSDRSSSLPGPLGHGSMTAKLAAVRGLPQ